MTSITPDNYIIGTPRLFYRDAGASTDPTFAGEIMGDMSFTIDQTWADQPDLGGARGPIVGMHYLARRVARAAFTLAEVAGTAMSIAVPGSSQTTRVTTATSGGWTTTTAADAAVGATTVKVTAVTSMAVGQYIKIGSGSTAEYRQLTRVGTLGSGGTGVSFFLPLKNAQASGVAFIQTDGDGATVTAPTTVRRLPTTAYKDWLIRQETPSGWIVLEMDNAVAVAASAEMTFGNSAWAGLPVTLEAAFEAGDLETEPWRFVTVPS